MMAQNYARACKTVGILEIIRVEEKWTRYSTTVLNALPSSIDIGYRGGYLYTVYVYLPSADNNQLQSTKQELFEAYLDVTYAVASSLSDVLDDQAADVTAVIPIIRQVRYPWSCI